MSVPMNEPTGLVEVLLLPKRLSSSMWGMIRICVPNRRMKSNFQSFGLSGLNGVESANGAEPRVDSFGGFGSSFESL